MAPAVEHAFDEPLPEILAVDADFVISVLHEGEEFHEQCAAFAARLLEERVSLVYSQLLRLEFLAGWQKAVTKRGIPARFVPRQAPLLPNEPAERRGLYRLGDQFLADFLSLFVRYEIRLSAKLQDEAREFMSQFGLKPLDSCLAACAFKIDPPAVASLDKAFRRVDGLHLWNGHIPETRSRRRAARRDR